MNLRKTLTAVFAGLALMLLAATVSAQDFRVTTVASGLDHPWSIAWLPDGTAVVTELPGRVRLLRGNRLGEPLSGVPPVLHAGQGGLFEALPHPQFATNRRIYLSYAHGTLKDNGTRIAHARLTDTGLTDLTVIFDVEPRKDTPVHYGGRMAWLPDGTLLMTTGDGFVYREAAQDTASLLGKIVRLNDDGSVPADNPLVATAGARPEIYSYGHRNPQGLLVDPADGSVWMHEHGAQGGDEINRITPGLNYGWPAVTYGIDYTGAYVSPYQRWPGLEEPVLQWTPSIAPSGMAVYRAGAFEAWRGNLFVTALAAQALYRVQLNGTEVIAQEVLLADLAERLRDVRVGPDGFLYILTDATEGRILRLEPDGPLAAASARPADRRTHGAPAQ